MTRSPAAPAPEATLALLPCCNLIEDFLDPLNLSFEEFCQQFIGSWMFGYIIALQQVNVRVVLFCMSAQVQTPTRVLHQPTGATICVLPQPRLHHFYRRFRKQSLSLYGAEANQTFTDVLANSRSNHQANRSLLRQTLVPIKNALKGLGTYCSIPLTLLAQELRREQCRAILCQEYEYGQFDLCVLLGKYLKLPVFATFQGGDRTLSWLEEPVRYLSLPQCAGVIIPSQTEIERVQQRYPIAAVKIAKIFNPFDPTVWAIEPPTERQQIQQQFRQQLGLAATAEVVIWHGRIELVRKGLDVLLAAWQQVWQERTGRDLKLILLGTGSDANWLQQQIDSGLYPGLVWQNEFISDRTRLKQYLYAADLYVFPSRIEGFALAPLEAMACGLPIVATDVSGIPDLLAAGEASGGVMVPRDDAVALAKALGQLLDDPARRQILGQRASQWIEQSFSMQVIGRQLRDFLLAEPLQADDRQSVG